MVSILNYEMGNIRSIQNALDFIGIDSCVIDTQKDILESEKLILPGVGSFAVAMENIRRKNLLDALNEAVLVKKIPILGICLGMQLLMDKSEEGGLNQGFGWIGGSVKRFDSYKLSIKVPHIGFNTVYFESNNSGLFRGLGNSADFYFIHSYRVECKDREDVSSWANYGERFAAGIQRKNIFGVQFHPEKSQTNGLAVIRNFCNLAQS